MGRIPRGFPLPEGHAIKGFTLIELLLALALLATLAAVSYPLTVLIGTREKEVELQHALRDIRTAIDKYKSASDGGRIEKNLTGSGYPPSLETLVEGVVDKTDLKGKRIFFLRRIPRDPMCKCADSSAIATWKIRSYTSTAENPLEGEDVFDVLSRSTRESLNGTHYNQW